MELSVDISAYPLADDYIPAIKMFIERLQGTAGLTVVCNTMSTQIFGEYDLVMNTIATEIKHSFATYGKAIFVYKMIPGVNLDPALKPHG